MTTIDRAQLYALFKPEAHASLTQALERADVLGLAVYEDDAADGQRSATPARDAHPPSVDRKGRRLVGVYLKDRLRLALAHLQENPGSTPYAAAQLYGVSKQALYTAVKKAQRRAANAAKPVCPCCGQPIQRAS
jgi:hypothetical protein